MPEMNFSPYVQKGLPGVKLSPKINADNYDCLWDAGSGTAKGFNASLEYCKAHDHCWHLGCILPKLPAMVVRTGGGWFGPCCIPKGSEPPRNAPGPPYPPPPPPPPTPPPVPGPAEGSFDGCSKHGAVEDCGGWVSGPRFSGPSLLVQLMIDGKPHGPMSKASVDRPTAGQHGFSLQFPAALIASGKHTIEVVAHKTANGPTYWTGRWCTLNGATATCPPDEGEQ